MMDAMNPHDQSRASSLPDTGFSLLEALTALAIFSGSYLMLVSAHAHIASHTNKQWKKLHALVAISNQHETQIALGRAKANE